MTLTKTLSCSILLASLAACGGTSSGGVTIASFQDLLDEGDALADATNQLLYTDPTTLPTGGSASYEGLIGVVAGDLGRVGGEMDLTANFATDAITGSVSNLYAEENDESLSGTLAITNGDIDRTADTDIEFTFVADLDGTVTGQNGEFVVDMELIGDFLGEDHAYVEGFVDGTITVGDEVTFVSDGGFIAER